MLWGGDRGPAVVVDGMARAAQENPRLRYIVHGPEGDLKRLVAKRNIGGICTIVHSDGVVAMADKPSQVMRHGQGTSMWSAVQSLKSKDAQVCVSCGNTGALMAVSMLQLRTMAGVSRPAIAVLWPSRNPSGFNVMLDVGADITADPQDLLAHATMGAAYAVNGFGIPRPRIGLLNVGTEETKGNATLSQAHTLLQSEAEKHSFTFIGFVEGGDIPSAKVDVIVTDGFTGNIALKTAEGTASFIGDMLRAAFKYSVLSRFASLLALGSLSRLRKRIDPRRVNGGVFLGLNGVVVKSHGSADATGFAAAIKLAYRLAEADFTGRLATRVGNLGSDNETGE